MAPHGAKTKQPELELNVVRKIVLVDTCVQMASMSNGWPVELTSESFSMSASKYATNPHRALCRALCPFPFVGTGLVIK